MIKKLLPILLLIVGAGAGAGAGLFLRPPPEPEMAKADMDEETAMEDGEMKDEMKSTAAPESDGTEAEYEYLKMSNQFVVPVVADDQVSSLVVMSLSLEVPVGQQQLVFTKEPKIRDSFLRVMFDHANVGGFDGAFTSPTNLDALRNALREIAQRDMGELVTDVLITEIARQDY